MRKKSLWVAACLCFCLCAVRQAAASSANPESHYDRGVSLYEKQRYAAAQAEFEKAAGKQGRAMPPSSRRRLATGPCALRRCGSPMPRSCSGVFWTTIRIRSVPTTSALRWARSITSREITAGHTTSIGRSIPTSSTFPITTNIISGRAMPLICAATRRPPTAISRTARPIPDICLTQLIYHRLYRLCEGRFGRGQAGVLGPGRRSFL